MTLVYLAIGLVVLAYLGLPLVIKSTLKINARPGMHPLPPALMPEAAQEYFAETGPKLTELGFEQPECFTMEPSVPNIKPHVTLWINRRSGQAATVNFLVVNVPGDKPPQFKKYVEFLTKLDGDRSILTNNSPELGAFKKTSASDTLSATRLSDVTHLYRLHLWREGALGAKIDTPRCLPRAGAELEWFAKGYEESIRRQVGTGYLELIDTECGIYAPTMQGAYMMTWSELPPMKQLRRSAEDKRAEAQIRHAIAAREIKPPANVRILSEPLAAGAGAGSTRPPQTPPLRNVA
jgi:hypothetical protein